MIVHVPPLIAAICGTVRGCEKKGSAEKPGEAIDDAIKQIE